MTIPVICDRCRTAGTAGSGDFSHFGDLLDFVPVEVQPRVNGWDPDAQRAFIALLATTGSKRRAAIAIGRNAFGIDQLMKRRDSDSFKAAYDRAKAIAKANGAVKLATGMADAAARNAQLTPPSRLPGLPQPLEEDGDEDSKLAIVERIFTKILLKVQQEREARLAGKIAAADFYLRQLTFLEVTFELMAEGLGDDPWLLMKALRRGGHSLIHIAETPMSRLLDDHRRALWAMIDGEEPAIHPPERYFDDKGTHSLQPFPALGPASGPPPGVNAEKWGAMNADEQRQVLSAYYAAEAEAQAVYESSALAPLPSAGEGGARSAEGEGR